MLLKTADEAVIRAMVADYERCGGGLKWLVDASAVKAYRAAAIPVAADEFGRLARQYGLATLIAIITAPTVRMGASVVAMSLRAVGSPLEIVIVATRAEAEERT
jgi:hypothetical protein